MSKKIAVEVNGKFLRILKTTSKTDRILNPYGRKIFVKELNRASLFVNKRAAKSYLTKDIIDKCLFKNVVLKPILID